MTTYRYNKQYQKMMIYDKSTGEWHEPPARDPKFVPQAPLIMSDMEPFISPVDGTYIGGREQRREYMKRNNLVEVGNDSSLRNPKKRELEYTKKETEQLNQDIADAYDQVSAKG